jgi:glutamine cyclotransferase
MAQHLRIRCVAKNDRTSAHERIHSVGGVKPDGSHWKLTQDKAISDIEDGTSVFYMERPAGHRIDVIVAVSAEGKSLNKYLKTMADGEQPEYLLSLPTCP